MSMMVNVEKTVLLYPEPDATGGGVGFDMSQAVMEEYDRKPWEETEAPAAGGAAEDRVGELTGDDGAAAGDADAPDAPDADDPFDFTKEDKPEEVKEEDGGEYTLDLGESFGGSDDVRSMITGHARELGLPADKAGAFVAAVCESLKAGAQEQRQSGYAELRKEWGRNFDANLQGTKRVLGDMLKAGVIKADQVEEFKSPAVFRAMNYLRSRMGEQGTKGLRTGGDTSRATELKDILENPDNAMAKILMNPLHPQYASTAKYVNGLAGMNLY